MKASAIRVDAPPKGKVGAVVVTQDVSRVLLKDLRRDVWGRFEEFPVG